MKERLVFVCIFLVITIPLTILFAHSFKQSTTLAENQVVWRHL